MLRYAIVLGALLPAMAPALADTMTLYMKNLQGHGVVLELSSQSRAMRWPGGNQVYLLEKGERKSVQIECEAGERLCWGGWAYGNDAMPYGTGPDGRTVCEACCMICVEKTTETIEIGG